ncbi:unnamed protein product [Rhizopus stolonifer]
MSTKEYTMDVEEASSILMSLANSNPKRDSMSIRNLIDANLPTEMPSKSLQGIYNIRRLITDSYKYLSLNRRSRGV